MWSELQMKAWPNQASISSEAFFEKLASKFWISAQKIQKFLKRWDVLMPKKSLTIRANCGLIFKIVVNCGLVLHISGWFWDRSWDAFLVTLLTRILKFLKNSCSFLRNLWLSVAWLAELSGWAGWLSWQTKEEWGQRRREKKKGRRKKKKEGERRNKKKGVEKELKEGSKEEVATLCLSVLSATYSFDCDL